MISLPLLSDDCGDVKLDNLLIHILSNKKADITKRSNDVLFLFLLCRGRHTYEGKDTEERIRISQPVWEKAKQERELEHVTPRLYFRNIIYRSFNPEMLKL